MLPSKRTWRARAEHARRNVIADPDRQIESLIEFLAAKPAGTPPGYTVLYHAIGGELDLSPVADCTELGPFALTRTPDEGLNLTVHPLDSARERHRYGYEQPVSTSAVVDDADISVVLVPGLAFDRRGSRLGRGMGYYDRFLARLSVDTLFVGITAGYVVAELPTDEYDVAMTHLLSDFGVLAVPLPDPD